MKYFLTISDRIAYWIIPGGIYDLFIEKYLRYRQRLTKEARLYISRNLEFKDKHLGERCFIIATGPSIKKQNLAKLQGEWCFGVSDFYKHHDYRTIKPAYYVIAQMHPPFTDQDGYQRLNELSDNRHNNETYFFNLKDIGIFKKSKLANNANRVFYLKLQQMRELPEDIDLASKIPNPVSVSIMALWIAIYMGFSEIYLLGCDHNHIWLWDGSSSGHHLEHFYQGAPSIGYGGKSFDIDQSLRAHLKVREQYRWANQIARRKNIKIFNASPTSYIDIFPKVNIEEIV